MCSRFALATKKENIKKTSSDTTFYTDDSPEDFKPRYNIAPAQNILTLLRDDETRLTTLRWGLIPRWSKDIAMGNNLVNARSETVGVKPAYKNSYENRRCLIFSTGFFEWKKIKGSKSKAPYFIKMKNNELFTFAGVWDRWISADGEIIDSASILTTEPNEMMKYIHDRMPVIIPGEKREEWLLGKVNESFPAKFFEPYPSDELTAYEVSTIVNNPSVDLPECILPVQGAVL